MVNFETQDVSGQSRGLMSVTTCQRSGLKFVDLKLDFNWTILIWKDLMPATNHRVKTIHLNCAVNQLFISHIHITSPVETTVGQRDVNNFDLLSAAQRTRHKILWFLNNIVWPVLDSKLKFRTCDLIGLVGLESWLAYLYLGHDLVLYCQDLRLVTCKPPALSHLCCILGLVGWVRVYSKCIDVVCVKLVMNVYLRKYRLKLSYCGLSDICKIKYIFLGVYWSHIIRTELWGFNIRMCLS